MIAESPAARGVWHLGHYYYPERLTESMMVYRLCVACSHPSTLVSSDTALCPDCMITVRELEAIGSPQLG